MKHRVSYFGLALTGIYVLFVGAALAVFQTYRAEDALASVFLMFACMPWTLFALDWVPTHSENQTLMVILGYCAVNALLLYLLGSGIGRLFQRLRHGPPAVT